MLDIKEKSNCFCALYVFHFGGGGEGSRVQENGRDLSEKNWMAESKECQAEICNFPSV